MVKARQKKCEILVLNQIDAIEELGTLDRLLERYPSAVPISARTGEGLGRLAAAVSDALIARFAEVVRATVKGNVIIATLQGTIGGVTFWLLGIPGALVWGAIMVFLSLLPAIGAALVWAPWALSLILSGNWLSGGILVFVGVAVIGLVDNLLRPPLVGNASRLPDYVVLVSTLGGLALFGINGFVIGPLIAALFVACWTLFRDARAGRTMPTVG